MKEIPGEGFMLRNPARPRHRPAVLGLARPISTASDTKGLAMLWIKALHLFFVIAWFAGLFYLPRLFVYHADTRDETGHLRFVMMERRLFMMMSIDRKSTRLNSSHP